MDETPQATERREVPPQAPPPQVERWESYDEWLQRVSAGRERGQS